MQRSHQQKGLLNHNKKSHRPIVMMMTLIVIQQTQLHQMQKVIQVVKMNLNHQQKIKNHNHLQQHLENSQKRVQHKRIKSFREHPV